ncbi:1-acyl-sn-glycerol-3-phosphate acyltransferase [Lentibacter algarum]|uniref:lysophospholipid acyltransferase family protein n=1 Tax=Lentibacter algarum TaxID=576131 RepID=UPI001C0A1272|nr:lysophospholipid acyltransferase family protein [Lentibacter algarum]MBU2982397.1 1-acyl-sn-glycerol-3-phosphate acyltransferase [Lentibacter algarum]
MSTWNPEQTGDDYAISLMGWLRVAFRALALIVLMLCGLAALLLMRLIEAPLFGVNRPWTPYITQFVCRTAFLIMGMKFSTKGRQMKQAGAVVANHGSWLDIFSLNASKRVYFVSKAEVANWPGIGWLARATGTVFIRRERADAKLQQDLFETRLTAGHKLLFFPEGTSTDGLRVLPFKSTLFAAFFTDHLRDIMWVQPVTVAYQAPKGQSPRFYGWWGDMEFDSHLLKTLAVPRQGSVMVTYHTPLKVSEFVDRKALAAACEHAVRSGMPDALIEAGHAYEG